MLSVAIVHSISLLYSTSFYEYNKIHSSILPSKYSPGLTLLSFQDLTRSGAFRVAVDCSSILFVMGVGAVSNLGLL